MEQKYRYASAQTDAGSAFAEGGLVILDGPDGVAVTMTPDAAEETARRLLSAAQEARGNPGVAS